ncbi:MAG TPA: hypothetical protein VGU20_19990 [Stellaceae bacterium]|nr:hypothetical protein [Stellaceae bacterium]
MPRHMRILAAIALLYPAIAVARPNTMPDTDERLTAIWDACDLRFGPVPDPAIAKNWTNADKQRATDVVECFRQIQRRLRDMPAEAIQGMIGI